MEFQPGIVGNAEFIVQQADSALAQGSGSLPVLATPRLVALMEQAACAAIAPFLEEGSTSVGIELALRHTAPTGVGQRVFARAAWTSLEGRILTFEIEAFDEHGSIGTATHRRCLVQAERFMQKVDAKHDNAV